MMGHMGFLWQQSTGSPNLDRRLENVFQGTENLNQDLRRSVKEGGWREDFQGRRTLEKALR